MKFLKLCIENYKCFQKPVEINLDIAEGQKNIVLIGGMNGSGKTAILEAINICLYGKSKAKIFRSINRRELEKGNGNVFFELQIKLDDGDILKIKRAWKNTSYGLNKITQSDLEEKLVLVKNDQRLAISDQGGWQDFLEKTIPHSITQFFFFNGEKIEYMASDKDSEGKLKESIEALLGIEMAKRLKSDLESIRKEQRKGRDDVIDEDIKAKEYQLEAGQKKLEDWKKELTYLEKDLNNLVEKAKEIESDFLKRFGFSADSAGELKEIEIKKIKVNARKAEIDKEIKQYCSNILPSGLLSNRFNLIIEQIKNERMLHEAKIAGRANENLADILLEKLYKPECIMCRKPFDENKKGYLKKEILEAISSLDKNNKESLKISPILNLSEREEKRLEASLTNKQSLTNLKDLLNEREDIIKELRRTENELSKLKVGPEDKDAFRLLQRQRDDVQQNIGRRKQEIRDLDEQIADKISTNNILERELNNLYEKYSQEKGKADLLVKISRMINVLNEFIDKLRISKLEDLRKHIFTMYRTLASKSDLIADIIIDPLTYRINIIDKHKTVIDKQNLSAGEKEVFAISLLWGLAKTSNYNLPIVVDTPLARLDSTHRNSIVTKYFPTAGEQVIILSTDTEVDKNYYKKLEPYIARVNHLLFDKYRELTTLEEGYFWEDNNGR